MAALGPSYSTYISKDVYDWLNEESKMGGDPKRNMWTTLGKQGLGIEIYGSTYWWGV